MRIETVPMSAFEESCLLAAWLTMAMLDTDGHGSKSKEGGATGRQAESTLAEHERAVRAGPDLSSCGLLNGLRR